jgi:hypothetical protein
MCSSLVGGFLFDLPEAEFWVGTASRPDAFRHSAARKDVRHRPVPGRASDMNLEPLPTDARQTFVFCYSKTTVLPWAYPGSTFPLPHG